MKDLHRWQKIANSVCDATAGWGPLGKLELRVYGGFSCRWDDGNVVAITGSKHRALLATLVLANDGVRTRNWLQEHLWGLSGKEHGRSSLRRALSDLRKTFGNHFDDLFELTNIDVTLKLDRVALVGGVQDGALLDGLTLAEPLFQQWIGQKRAIKALPAGIASVRDNVAPVVAVLPLMSSRNSPDETHFGDMLALEIARCLSRSRLVNVISHLSSRQFGGPHLNTQALRSGLNADYALHGSVRTDGSSYRLDVDFIEVETGRILWSRPFGGAIAEVLNGDAALVYDVGRQCGLAVLSASIELAYSRPLPQVASHALFMTAITGMHQHQISNFARSREQLEELALRFPSHSTLHSWIAKWYLLAISQGLSVDPSHDTQLASDACARALDINPNCAFSLTIDGMVQGGQDEMNVSADRFAMATELDPNQALGWLMYSRMNSFMGNGAVAVQQAQQAMKLSPLDPHRYFYDIMASLAHFVNGDLEEANTLADRSIRANPRHTSSYRVKAFVAQSAGHESEARETMKILRKLEPNLTVSNYLSTHSAGNLPTGQHWAQLLSAAGLPLS